MIIYLRGALSNNEGESIKFNLEQIYTPESYIQSFNVINEPSRTTASTYWVGSNIFRSWKPLIKIPWQYYYLCWVFRWFHKHRCKSKPIHLGVFQYPSSITRFVSFWSNLNRKQKASIKSFGKNIVKRHSNSRIWSSSIVQTWTSNTIVIQIIKIRYQTDSRLWINGLLKDFWKENQWIFITQKSRQRILQD